MVGHTPIKYLEPDDTNSQISLEGWLLFFHFHSGETIVLAMSERRQPFFSKRGKTIAGSFWRRMIEVYFVWDQNYAGYRLVFHFIVSFSPGVSCWHGLSVVEPRPTSDITTTSTMLT